MQRTWGRRIAAGAALVLAASGVGGAVSMTAASARSAAPAARAVSPVGTYDATLASEGLKTKLVIKKDPGISAKEGAFRFPHLDESGNWMISGATLTLLVTSASASARIGMVFIGTVSSSGITGAYELPDGEPGLWNATRAGAAPAAVASRPDSVAPIPGAYTLDEGGGLSSFTLTDGAGSSLAGSWASPAGGIGSGEWVAFGRHIAMGAGGGAQFGSTFVGTVTPTGLSDRGTIGAHGVHGAGIAPWAALRGVCSTTFTADIGHGSDTDDGTCVRPFKTVHKALSVATSGQSIGVDPGVYSPDAGEQYPLTVPDGITVVGDATGRGASPVTEFEGGELELYGTGATVEGVWEDGLVEVSGANAALLDSTVTGGGGGTLAGICIDLNATGAVLTDDDVRQCDTGVRSNVGSDTVLRGNTVHLNRLGVDIEGGAANLGTKGVYGNNVMSCNTQIDLTAKVSSAAWGDTWDHAPPTIQTSGVANGTDVYELNGAAVNVGFAKQVSNPCS